MNFANGLHMFSRWWRLDWFDFWVYSNMSNNKNTPTRRQQVLPTPSYTLHGAISRRQCNGNFACHLFLLVY